MITEMEARDWVGAYGEAWMQRDPGRVAFLFAENASYQERRFRQPLRGIAAIRDYWREIVVLQRDIVFEPRQLVVVDHQAFMHWHAHFTWRPVNVGLELDAMTRITFGTEKRDGLRLALAFEEWIDSRET